MKWIFLWLMFCTTLAPQAASGASPYTVMQLDFENGLAHVNKQGIAVTLPKASNAIVVDCVNARTGRCSMRTEIDNTPEYISHAAHRAESDSHLIKETLYSEFDQMRYGFSLYVANSWETDSRESIDIIWQFKRTGTQPDIFLAIKGEDIVLRAVGGKQEIIVKNYPRGKWIDFRLGILWSPGEAGTINAEVRLPPREEFVLATNMKGQNMVDSRAKSGYIKWGLYKPDYKNSKVHHPRVVFHDDIYIEHIN